MPHQLAQIVLLVNDYDEAIEFYTEKLLFELVEDTQRSPTKRWVRIRPQGATEGPTLLLAKAKNEEQRHFVGNQAGGRVFLFLHVDNFDEYFDHITSQGVEIRRPPSVEDFGKVALFADLYGNVWDLIDPRYQKT
jgi:catechol 2,3-dioxygenase-like lactoylglutathione lyase family enzyme